MARVSVGLWEERRKPSAFRGWRGVLWRGRSPYERIVAGLSPRPEGSLSVAGLKGVQRLKVELAAAESRAIRLAIAVKHARDTWRKRQYPLSRTRAQQRYEVLEQKYGEARDVVERLAARLREETGGV